MERQKFTPWGPSGAPKPTGRDCLDLRSKPTDRGELKVPPGGGAPSTKGDIVEPKQVGK